MYGSVSDIVRKVRIRTRDSQYIDPYPQLKPKG